MKPLPIIRAFGFSLMLPLLAAASDGAPVHLPEKLAQGDLVVGRTQPGSEVVYGDRSLRVDAQGRFVFGLGRDEAGPVSLLVKLPDGRLETLQRPVASREWKIERVDGVPQQTVTPDPAIAARIAREQARVVAARERDDDRSDFAAGFRWPLQGRISGVYGSQRIYNGTPRSPHSGLDVAAPNGTPIRAPASGVVTFADPGLYLTGGTVLLDQVPVDAELVIDNWRQRDIPNIQGAASQLIQAAIDAGIAEAAIEEAIRFVREKSRPWIEAKVERASDDPYVIADIGRLKLELHAAEALLRKAARVLDEVNATPVDAAAAARASIAVAEAKVLTTEISLQASEKLFELAGSRATLAEFNLDRHWRNARVHTLHDPVRWKYHAVGAYHLNGTLPARHSWI